MNKVIITVVVLAVIVGGFFLLSSPSPESNNEELSANQQQQLSYETIMQEVYSGSAYLIDVRTPEEYAAGYIEGATLFPLQDIQAGQYPDLSKEATVYVYCRSGSRSAQATSLLEKEGYTNVVDLGSYQDVQAIGGPLVQ